ncbi:F-box/kelch-repeat protein At3g06240-like [Vicia villosa]|uniref:F-box/kelch-repeat protein At3g06240-like n=1 Tax=Vicia villosa TaxID=3911 RepID=UPI00273B172C|nr:F-box/kelch-repeat protein At3g06240-like [Vicia villosa]
MGATIKHIHDDFAFVVLSKLPLKSLIRFCCVRKSWSDLFDNTYFMNMFRKNFLLKNHSHYNDTSLLLRFDESWIADNPCKSGMYSLSGERYENMIQLDLPDLLRGEWSFQILGSTSINGFLFIDCKQSGKVVLWNPNTNEYKVIPPSPFSIKFTTVYHGIYGFGYDSVRNNYKVIRQVELFNYNEERSSFWEIYCLKTNTWKTVDIDMPIYYQDNAEVHLYKDEKCHWLAKCKTYGRDSETHNKVYLLSFNMSDEMFVTTSIPSDVEDDVDYRYLAMLSESIALISVYAETTSFHISILSEVGRNESWTKLFILKSLSCIGRPIGVSKNCDIFFIKEDGELAWINLSTEKIENLGLNGAFNCKVINHKKSLVKGN